MERGEVSIYFEKTSPNPLTNFLRNDKLDNVASEKTTLENSLKNISNLLLTESSKPVKLTKSLFDENVIRVKALLKLRKKF
ncbi:hypothetical protein DWV91_00005 [Enterococcus asini]|nr:hypothetical protein DWV91_00005 [Enterococcus asini]